MPKKILQTFIICGCLVAVLISISACGDSRAEETVSGPDILAIAWPDGLGGPERPLVKFPHEVHVTAAEKDGQDCSFCHLTREDGFLSHKFMRLENTTAEEVENIYHDNCLKCHQRLAEAGQASGPEACGECHRRDNKFQIDWSPIYFDKSLHYRHIEANENRCDLCHHEFDEATQTVKYVKGAETACRDCHGNTDSDKTVSYRKAAHYQCLKCHMDHPQTGPVSCSGCHSANTRAAITFVENPPRLKRNQPDLTLISAPEAELDQSKMNTVLFNHEIHEGITMTCRICHHQTLKACDECHTLEGDPKVNGVNLQQAMHSMKSDHSCVGCHDNSKNHADCAGCHNLMEQGKLSEHACPICHSGPEPDKMNTDSRSLDKLAARRSGAAKNKLSFAVSDIPEEVTINKLADKYEPAVFPHRKIVNNLIERVNKSRMALYFHGNADVICQGCHHHSPVGEKPPLCESCHGQPFNEDNLFRPGLKGAYHRQCMGCHQQMGIGKDDDCLLCHKMAAGEETIGSTGQGD